jgi:hypothetical protein
MIDIDKSIDSKQINILEEGIGKKLNRVEYADVMTDDTSWNTIRLHFEGLSIDINCFLEPLPEDEVSNYEEYGIIGIHKVPTNEKLEVKGFSSETSIKSILKTVRSIHVINSTIKVFDNSKLCSTKTITKAIVFDFGDEMLAIDRQIFYEEVLTFKFGTNLNELIYDDSESWESGEEDDITFEYSLERIEL